MKVIGAGMGRTGTLSIKAALEELGFGPCYHQFEVVKNPEHSEMWAAAACGEYVDWRELFKNYRATVDWPGCAHYEEIMEAFPEAKVLLSVRDPDRWYESTLMSIYGLTKTMDDLSNVTCVTGGQCKAPKSYIWDGTFSGRFEDREYAIEVFNRHNEEVKRRVPSDWLLVYEVKEGWGPLCEFLGVEVPEGKPFPHLNGTDALMNLPYAKRVRERFEEHQQANVGVERRLVPATLRSTLGPGDLSSKLRGAVNGVKGKVDRLRLTKRLTTARSLQGRTGTVAENIVDAEVASKEAVVAAYQKKGGAE